MTTFAIIGMGAMGSAIAQVLVANGAQVISAVEDRSPNTIARARLSGVTCVAAHDITSAELILSVVPPSEALATAEHVRDLLRETPRCPAYLDLNAISPATMVQVEAALRDANVKVFDGTIIGTPPRFDGYNPNVYVSSDREGITSKLADYGLRLKHLDGPLGAASALKMCYAGINKGFSGLGAAMLLAAQRAGSDLSLREELADSLPAFNERLSMAMPDMLPKARRWVSEMDEISIFLGPSDPAHAVYRALGKLFAELADDFERGGVRTRTLL